MQHSGAGCCELGLLWPEGLSLCCGGVRQTVQGDGTAFLAAMGTLMKKELAPGEVFVIDTNSLVAWDKTATAMFSFDQFY